MKCTINNFLALTQLRASFCYQNFELCKRLIQHVPTELSAIATLQPWHPETPGPNPRVAPFYAKS